MTSQYFHHIFVLILQGEMAMYRRTGMRDLIFGTLVLLVWVSGCTYPVDDLDSAENKLIVQCEFEPGSDIMLYVFKGIGIPADYEIPVVPDSVQIQIFKGNSSLDVVRRIAEIPYYETRGFVLPGDKLLMKARVPDGELREVYADTYVPLETELKDLIGDCQLVTDTANRYAYDLKVEFGFEDLNDEKFYEIEVYLDEIATNDTGGTVIWEVLEHPVKINHITDEFLKSGVDWLESRRSFLVDFKKLNLSRRVELKLPIAFEKKIKGVRLNFVVKSHTASGYRYLYTYNQTRYQYAAVNPVLISNIENGIGCFIACTRIHKPLELVVE